MNILSQLTITAKLVISYSVLALLILLVGWFGYNGIIQVSDTGNSVLNDQVPINQFSLKLAIHTITSRDLLAEYLSRSEGLDEIERNYDIAMKDLKDELNTSTNLKLSNSGQILVDDFKQKMKEYEQLAKEMLTAHRLTKELDANSSILMERMDAEVGSVLEKVKSSNFTMDEFELITEFIMAVNDYIITESPEEAVAFAQHDTAIRRFSNYPKIATEYDVVYRYANETVENVKNHIQMRNEAFEKMEALDAASVEMESMVNRLQTKSHQDMTDAIASANNIQQQTNTRQGVLTIAGLILAVLLSIFIARSITIPIAKITERLRDIADGEGDLTQRVDISSNDELGTMVELFNRFIVTVHDIIAAVTHSTQTVANGAQQIAQGNTDLSQRSQEQASSLEETAASIEQLSASTKENARIAQESDSIAQNTVESALSGEEIVKKTTESMKAVTESSNRISDITHVVNDLAFQTNLLALNAAVEAARAGEQGRGFAVVASEVRNLATKSADAAKEIKSLIAESVDKVSIGNQLVEETGSTLTQIIEQINDLAHRITDISSFTSEQASAIDQVNIAITQIDDVVQNNASLVEEAAATSETLSAEALNLEKLLSQFKTNEAVIARAHHDKSEYTPLKKVEVAKRNYAAISREPVEQSIGWEEF